MPLTKCSKCRRYCRLVATFLFSHIGLCALVVGYSIIGAFTFEALEAGHEQTKRDAMRRERENVVTGLWILTSRSTVLSEHNWSAMAIETLQDFEVTLVKAVRKEGYDGKDDSPLQWTFSGALLYSIIVITTIGYGNIAPKTPWGKVVTILYAIVGIPLLLLCLSNIGDAMAHSFKFIYWKVCCYLCVRPKKRRKRAAANSNRPVSVPYRQPAVHQRSNHVQAPPPVCGSPVRESPPLHSSSTYHTAPSCSSPTISSVASTPLHQQNDYILPSSKLPIALHQPPTPAIGRYYAPPQDIPLAPVITNKYALQEDAAPLDNRQLQIRTKESASVVYPSAIFTILNPRKCDKYQQGNHHQAYGTNERFQWTRDPYHDTDIDMTDEESLRDLTPEPDEEGEVSVPMWLCVALVVSYICGGAVLFTFWEKWNFLDSSYFCFVTLTTIGFGDLVPGTAVISDDNQLTLGLCSLYLLFGMALLAMSFNLVQEEVTRSMRCIGKRIGIVSDDEDD